MTSLGKPLLIIEDDKSLQKQLRWIFKGFMGYQVHLAANREEGLATLQRVEPGVVLLDLCLPPEPESISEGMKTLQEILAMAPTTKVIIITGDGDRAHALEAISLGAFDFFQKPVEPDIIALIIERAYRVHELEKENQALNQKQQVSPLDGLVAVSPQMQQIVSMIERIAPIDVTVLLLGASGTGKERIVQAIHRLSPRKKEKVVAINCASIPTTLLESELFGHEKGAFTGATTQKIGKIERANGGTLFLDEIGDLPFELQAKLLRFLQERVIERLGGHEEIPVDTRIICATHQDIEKMIAEGTFREDLYYRIREITLKIPPLKDREGDAVLLAKVFLDRFVNELKLPAKALNRDAIRAIETYDWPGNVRELEGCIKRAAIMSTAKQVTPVDLGLDEIESDKPVPEKLNLKNAREDVERRALIRALVESNRNISDAATMLGVARPTVYKLMEKYNIKLD